MTNTDSIERASTEVCEAWTVGDPVTIWPPNHKMRQFTLDDCVTVNTCAPDPDPEPGPAPDPVCGNGVVEGAEQCDDGNDNPYDGCDRCILVDTTQDKRAPTPANATGTTLQITSITSSEDGGHGHHAPDYRIIDDVTFELRAERDGRRRGRTYEVNFVDQDGAAGTCTFVVPHDRGGHGGGCGH